MRYKLLNSQTYTSYKYPISFILGNRGMKEDEIQHLMNLSENDINDYKLLGEEKLHTAYTCLKDAIINDKNVFLLVDSDCDGYTSAAILYNYLYKVNQDWCVDKITYHLHDDKSHGLQNCVKEAKEYDVVLCPDSGSNDIEEHKKIYNLGHKCICLDHHIVEKESDYAIVINNQNSDYPNKDLSGAGIVWQFCRYFDEQEGTHYADEFLDLLALGNCSDMMSMKSFETNYLINLGFKESNIKNPFIKGVREKNAYSIGSVVTPTGASWYISPFVNAIARSGTLDEKKLVFESMLLSKAYELMLSDKRGHYAGEKEPLYENVMRLITRVKTRQTKAESESISILEKKIVEDNMIDDKAFVFCFSRDAINKNIGGLAANKLAAKYKRPVCILLYGESDKVASGSARGYDDGGIKNFKQICDNFEYTTFTGGHNSAFGVGVFVNKINEFKKYLNEQLKDYDCEVCYDVDFIFTNDNLHSNVVLEIGKLKHLWGKNLPEPIIAINCEAYMNNVRIYKKSKNTVCIKVCNNNFSDEVELIKFNVKSEECEWLEQIEGKKIKVTSICTCDVNEWNGQIRPQLKVIDWEFEEIKEDVMNRVF